MSSGDSRWWLDLLAQVKHVLGIGNGGTGNPNGWGRAVVKACPNSTGSTILRGKVVDLVASYDDARIQMSPSANDTAVLGVVVGRYDEDGVTFADDDCDDGETAAVMTSGTCQVTVSAAVTRGQFAFVGATAGQAVSSATYSAGVFGRFQGTTAGAGSATVVLAGASAVNPGMLADHVHSAVVNQGGNVLTPRTVVATATAIADIPLSGVGMAAQVGNLLELRDSTGAVILSVGPAGAVAVQGLPSSLDVALYGASANPAPWRGQKSRNAAIGGHTIVLVDDGLFQVTGQGSDGVSFRSAARLLMSVDGTPGVADMPGRLTLWTTPDGSPTPVERVRVDSTGNAAFAYGLRFQGVISPAQLTANTDNYAPAGGESAAAWRVSTDANRDLTGIVPVITGASTGTSGSIILLHNIGSFDLVLKHNVTSTAANRFFCPSAADYTLKANASVMLWYDSTTSRWRLHADAEGVLAGKITNYNNIPTEGYGVPAIVDYVALTGQVADIGSTNMTNANVAGIYRVSCVLLDTTASALAGTVTVTVSWTDAAGATNQSASVVLTALSRYQGVLCVPQLASGSISYAVTHTGIFSTAVYALYLVCERLA